MFVFSGVEREENRQKNDNWNLWILVFFGPKIAVSWRTSAFQKKGPENPIFIVFLGCALFGPSCQKKGNFGHPPKEEQKFSLITESSFLSIFVFFLFFLFSFFCFFCFVVFCVSFWRNYGWPEGPPHLALNPPYLFFFVFVLFLFFFFGIFCFLGGFKCFLLLFCFFFGSFLCF